MRAYVPNHPMANIHGYVLHHRIVAENKIGRLLTEKEVVHHLDNNSKNNNPDNLAVIANQTEHFRIHNSGRTLSFTSLVCHHCVKPFQRETRQVKNNPRHYCSRRCMFLEFTIKTP